MNTEWEAGNVVSDFVDKHGWRQVELRNGKIYFFRTDTTKGKPISVSKSQRSALRLMAIESEWYSSFALRASLSTMAALEKKGLVESKNNNALGAFYSPQTTIKYRRKPA